MNAYDFVHLVIHAAGGRVHGRTKLQSVAYFAGVLAEQIQNLSYRDQYYGPFSPAVAGAVQELRGLKFLEQHISPNEAGDDSGFEMTLYEYALTPEGQLVAEEKAEKHPAEWARIKDAVRRLEESGFQDYVRLAVAAKTDSLARQTGAPPPALKEKAREHGWKGFNDQQYADAVQFLRTVIAPQPTPASA